MWSSQRTRPHCISGQQRRSVSRLTGRYDGWPTPRSCLLTARRPTAVLAAFAVGFGVIGCEIGFVDRGGSFVVDCRSGVDVLARIKKTVSTESRSGPVYEVVEVPSSSRLVVAVQPFGGDVISEIEALTESCESFGTSLGFPVGGRVIRIGNGPTAIQVREWPEEVEPLANPVAKCPVAEASPSR